MTPRPSTSTTPSRPRAAHDRPGRRPSRIWLALGLTAVLAAPVAAHEFWIEPTDFDPEAGQVVGIRLFVGDGFDQGSPYARNPRHLESFFIAAEERQPIPGNPGSEPAGTLVAEGSGTLAVGYESRATSLTLEAERFEAYLRDEGLAHIIEDRQALGESAADGREGFSRAAKSLLVIPGSGTAGFDRQLGLAVEIVPETDPFDLEAGEALEVLVLRHGEPLANTQVRAFLRGRPEATFDARTDQAGRASLELGTRGTWLLSLVHMERAPAGDEVDWLSTWSSLTFTTLRPPAAIRAEAASSNQEEYAE